MNPPKPAPEVPDDADPTLAEPGPEPTLDALLDEHHASVPELPVAPLGPACVVGECVNDRHPSLRGRVLVRWREDERALQRWLPTLQGLPVRRGDRLLLLRPSNGPARGPGGGGAGEGGGEAIVIGVVDGFAERPTPDRRELGSVELRRDEGVVVRGHDGRALVEIREGDAGPVIELLHEDLELATPGRLRLRAKQIEVEAERGQVEIAASDDVVVRGEVIRLN